MQINMSFLRFFLTLLVCKLSECQAIHMKFGYFFSGIIGEIQNTSAQIRFSMTHLRAFETNMAIVKTTLYFCVRCQKSDRGKVFLAQLCKPIMTFVMIL